MKKVFKSCSVYQKQQGFYVIAYIHTDYGEVGRPPVVKLPSAATSSDLGDAVLRVLNELPSEFVQIDLPEAMATFRTHLKELGFKTIAAFEKNASVAGVEFDGEMYTVLSHEKDERNMNAAIGSEKLPQHRPKTSAEHCSRPYDTCRLN